MGGVVYQIGRIGKRKTQPSYAKLCIRLYETKSRKEKMAHSFQHKKSFHKMFVVVVLRPQYASYIHTVHKKEESSEKYK